MTDNLFQPVETPQFDENKDYLAELVGENKKFKDASALAKGKAQADAFVETLKSELDTMRTDYMKLREEHMAGATLKDLVDQMKREQQHSNGDTNHNAGEVKQPEINLDEIKKSILTDLQKEKEQEQERSNRTLVFNKLKERLGNNFQATLNQQREALGMTETQVNDLASKSPAAFFRLMGLENSVKTEGFQAPPSSTQRSDNFSPTTQKRTWAWWQDLKKKDPKAYWDPKNITQRHKDADTLGDDFDDGDAQMWNRLGNPNLRYSN